MTLQEAIKIAETERKSKVVGAGDCGDKWMFTFEADVNKTDGGVLFVKKENGEVNFILPVLFIESLARGEITCTHMDLNGVVKNGINRTGSPLHSAALSSSFVWSRTFGRL